MGQHRYTPEVREVSCTTVPLRPHEDPNHVAVLVDRSPKVLAAPRDQHEHFITVPNAISLSVAPFRGRRELGTELHAPATNCFVGHLDASLRDQILNVSKTERKALIQSNGMREDLFWVPVTSVARL